MLVWSPLVGEGEGALAHVEEIVDKSVHCHGEIVACTLLGAGALGETTGVV